MDLTTLIAACALSVAPQVMHALIWRASGAEPWSIDVGERRVMGSVREALDGARAIQPSHSAIRVGLTGRPSSPAAVTAAMFAPCENVAATSAEIAQMVARCKTTPGRGDPTYCAIAAWRGTWDHPDVHWADLVRATAERHDAPDFEIPASAQAQHGIESETLRAKPDGNSPLFPAVVPKEAEGIFVGIRNGTGKTGGERGGAR